MRELIDFLIKHIKDNPTLPNSGDFSQAVALLISAERNAIPAPEPPLSPEQRAQEAERFVKATLARQLANSLIQRASAFEQLAEFGQPEGRYGDITVDATYRPTLSDEQRATARAKANELRDRAIALLSEVGVGEHFAHPGAAIMAPHLGA